MKRSLRKALLDGELTLGAWLQIGHPACAEIFARAGFDWVCVDLEHGAIDLETMTNIFRALDSLDCIPVARLPMNDAIWIRRTLDAGARALIIPMVNTAEEAEAAIGHAKYPPGGTRGLGPSRASMHGLDFDEYIARANDEIAMIMQIEHTEAIANIDSILQVPDVDAVFIGPTDLSGSMGITGQLEHPDMLAALETYRAACKKHNKPAGIHLIRPSEENIHQALDQGYTLVSLGLDTLFLIEASKKCLNAARQRK